MAPPTTYGGGKGPNLTTRYGKEREFDLAPPTTYGGGKGPRLTTHGKGGPQYPGPPIPDPPRTVKGPRLTTRYGKTPGWPPPEPHPIDPRNQSITYRSRGSGIPKLPVPKGPRFSTSFNDMYGPHKPMPRVPKHDPRSGFDYRKFPLRGGGRRPR